MKVLNKVNSMLFIGIFAFILSLSVVSALAFAVVNEFADAANLVGKVSAGGMTFFEKIMILFFAVFLPIGCIILGSMSFKYKQTKKQAEQVQDSMNIYFIIGLTSFMLSLFLFFIFV